MNRPSAMNSLNRELAGALIEALERIRDDDTIRVGVLTGNGRAFCAGADMKERAATGVGSGGLGGGSPRDFFASPPCADGVPRGRAEADDCGGQRPLPRGRPRARAGV